MGAPEPKSKKKDDPEPREHNPKWKSYTVIVLSSLVSFSSVSNIPKSDTVNESAWAASVSFGAVSFGLVLLLIMVDRSPFTTKCEFHKMSDGKLEGIFLIFLVLWWIIGVGFMTRVGGLAYQVLNMYFSAWICLFASAYTLNEWSTAKDIISFHELTRLSATLKSWYVLLFASVVTFSASADAQARLIGSDKNDTSLGISFGLASSIVASCAILEHYKLMCCRSWLKHGGWLELFVSIVLIVMWLIAVIFMTQDKAIAATITGTNPNISGLQSFPRDTNCTVVVEVNEGDETKRTVLQDCEFIPGSNLFFSTWACLFSSFAIAARWKAAQAIQFAQAQDKNMLGGTEDENDDDDDFVDAVDDAL